MRSIAVAVVWLSTACASSQPNITTVKSARYDAELSVVQRAVHDQANPILEESPDGRRIKTRWLDLEVWFAGSPAPKKFRVQYEITIVGERPWHVEVVGLVGEGALEPSADRSWLTFHTDRLAAAIYRRLEKYTTR